MVGGFGGLCAHGFSLFSFAFFYHLHKPLDHVGVGVREKGTLLFIESGNSVHILVGKGKTEHVEIFAHALDVRRLGDDDYAALNVPAEHYLRHRFAVFCGNLFKHGAGEKSAPSLAERRPGLVRDAVLFHPFVRNLLLIVRVRFDLVDHRLYACETAQVDEPVGIEVGNADCAQFALGIQFLERPPCAVVIGKTADEEARGRYS